MKSINFLSLVIILFLSACTDDHDDVRSVQTETGLIGSWNLVNVSGGMLPQNFDFERGLIAWTFNENQTVTIVNNNTDDSKTDYFDSGTYPYEYLVTHDLDQSGQEIIINGQGMGITVLENTRLTMSQAPVDGMTVILVR